MVHSYFRIVTKNNIPFFDLCNCCSKTCHSIYRRDTLRREAILLSCNLNTSLTLRIHCSTTMNPFIDSNIFVRMAQDMEDEDHDLEVATYQHRRRRALNERRYAGSIPGRVRIHRDHISGDARIRADYFCAQPVYTDAQFRRRYVFCYAHLFTSIVRTSHLY